MNKKVILIILDGWGIPKIGEEWRSAIDKANVPFYKHLLATYPHSTLQASGLAVGLPDGQMGNSEVGHLNIGAGRIVWQELARINKAIRERELHENPVLQEQIQVTPNPFHDRLMVALSARLRQPELRLYSGTGQLARQQILSLGVNTISTPDLSAGLYFWEVRSSGRVVSRGKVVRRR